MRHKCIVKKGYSKPYLLKKSFQIDIDDKKDLIIAESFLKIFEKKIKTT